MKHKLSAIIFSLPVAPLIFFTPLQPLGRLALSPLECRVQKWYLPTSSSPQTTTEKSKSTSPPSLVPVTKTPFACCEVDTSCKDQQIFGEDGDKKALLTAIDRSLQYLQTPRAVRAYQKYKIPEISRERVEKSLTRFRQILLQSKSAPELNAAIAKEFVLYQSVGHNNRGSVLFTSYYEPIYAASRVPTGEYRYPMYRLPPDIKSWRRPHPTRLELEGADGLQGDKGRLKGLELFWFRDRLEPYMIQIQGSGRLQLTDGTQTTVGYAGNVAHNYKSIGREMIQDGVLPKQGVTMPTILDYFQKNPQALNIYIPRDPSFVFFQETYGSPASGSIAVSLTKDRSIATDKSLMPPGALALIRAYLPFPNTRGEMEHRIVSRYVLDQDAGGAIKGAGRVDYFTGSGKVAGERAGVTVGEGQFYYPLLKQ
ncbi:MAG: murein transglycosylase A [Calothrix sp. MO_167.B12]|nr:murein transglycosylase A [Calothrix sp. MO_167.B12]